MFHVDIIVIGSGLGGLEVALSMAQQGMKVLVLERQKQAGGCMQSYRRGALQLDTGLHYIGGLEQGSQLRQEFERLGLMQLPWEQMDADNFEEIHINNHIFHWPQGIKQFIRAMKGYFPHESAGLDKYQSLLSSNDDVWMQQTNAWKYLNSIISDPTLIQVLSAPCLCKMDLNSAHLPLFTFVHGTTPYIKNSWRLASEGNALVDNLVRQIKNLGGEVICNKDVIQLEEKNGKICQAVCTDGSSYYAKCFVSNAHPSITSQLLHTSKYANKTFWRRLNSLSNTHGIFTLHLQIHEQALRYFNHNKIILSTGNCWDCSIQDDKQVKGIMISARRPTKGQWVSNIDILTPMSWQCVAQYQVSTPLHRPQEYIQLKQEISNQCLNIAEIAISGIKSMIKTQWSSTPLTYLNYNLTPRGSAFGYSKDYSDPLSTIISPRTNIHNLFLTGQSLMLHGVQGVTMTATHTCQEINRYLNL